MSSGSGTSDQIERIVKEANMPVTVAYVTRKAKKSWPTCRVALLKLVAEGKILGEQILDGGWVFRPKQVQITPEMPA